VSDTLRIFVIVGTRTDEHSLRSQVGMESESDCLFGQFDRILWISDSEAGVKVEKTAEVLQKEKVDVEMLCMIASKGQTKVRYVVGEERSEAVIR